MFKIRDANETDMAKIAAIYAYYVDSSFATSESNAPDAEGMKSRWEQTLASRLPFLVADQKGQIVGFSYARQFRSRAGYDLTVENSVYVRQGLEGHGIGGALLEGLLTRCQALGKNVMVAVTGVKSGDDWSESPSYRLHRRYGFAVCGLLPGTVVKKGQRVDVLILQKQL